MIPALDLSTRQMDRSCAYARAVGKFKGLCDGIAGGIVEPTRAMARADEIYRALHAELNAIADKTP